MSDWSTAPTDRYVMATWSNQFSWPARRVVGTPFGYGIVPRRRWQDLSSIVDDERPVSWRDMTPDERRSWQGRVGEGGQLSATYDEDGNVIGTVQ